MPPAAPDLSTAELSARTGIKAETLRWWRHVGRGPAWYRDGRTVRYPQAEVDKWKQHCLHVPATA